MGSGKVINAAIKKHGIENFTKVILETFENAEAMYAREKEVVTDEFLLREDVYNLRRGGSGGFDYINRCKLNYNPEGHSLGGKKTQPRNHLASHSGEVVEKRKRTFHKNNPNWGKREDSIAIVGNTEEAIAKKKATFKDIGHQQGNKNSQFGTCWIWHELVGNKKCKKDMLPLYIEQGWIKGVFGN